MNASNNKESIYILLGGGGGGGGREHDFLLPHGVDGIYDGVRIGVL
jgi:hypothetical protein